MTYADSDRFVFCMGLPSLPFGAPGIDPKRSCCFTGHRPENMPTGDDLALLSERVDLFTRILNEQGTDTFITGMSRGFDLMAAELILTDPLLRNNVRLVCALPYKGQIAEMRTEHEREIYLAALRACDMAVYFFEDYRRLCYRVRNRFMVNYSSHLIGYLAEGEKGKRSGTYQTVSMAKEQGIDTIVISGKEIVGRGEHL